MTEAARINLAFVGRMADERAKFETEEAAVARGLEVMKRGSVGAYVNELKWITDKIPIAVLLPTAKDASGKDRRIGTVSAIPLTYAAYYAIRHGHRHDNTRTPADVKFARHKSWSVRSRRRSTPISSGRTPAARGTKAQIDSTHHAETP